MLTVERLIVQCETAQLRYSECARCCEHDHGSLRADEALALDEHLTRIQLASAVGDGERVVKTMLEHGGKIDSDKAPLDKAAIPAIPEAAVKAARRCWRGESIRPRKIRYGLLSLIAA
jgi:hypothetical protein